MTDDGPSTPIGRAPDQPDDARIPTIPELVARELAEIVGEEWVRVERASVDEFKDPFWIPGDETYAASAVVQPGTVEEVQEVLRLANRHGVPVSPHSQGRNLGHGGASPRKRGAIQLGFQRMNRVLEIDEELALAVVEPGVTWQDLYDEVSQRGLDLLTPVPDLGWGSVVGNTMDSGHTYQDYGADYRLAAGFEVVLPDGELLRTGQGAIPGGKAGHTYRRSLGPSLDELFIQSNLGIVVRMGVWLKRRPEAYAPLVLVVGEDEDLEAAVDTIRELRLAGHLEGVPALYSTLRAAHMVLDAPVPPRALPYSVEELRQLGTEKDVGAWALRAAVWGDREIVEIKLRRVLEAWERIPSGRVHPVRVYARTEYEEFTRSAEKITIGIPTLKAIESTPDHVAHLDVSPVVPMRGSAIREVVEELRGHYAGAGLSFGVGIMVVGERSAVAIAGIRYDRTDEVSARTAVETGRRMVAALGELGYGDCRPHLEFMDLAQSAYSFNGHAYRRFVERLKDAVDPNGVLAPGRHGIWPARDRADGAVDPAAAGND
ncbi:FAD-binding oxidoreductase [Modestobacter roseus]|uniref:4-cresol dehydrogenase (Hydroxylating) n=1 Tax=Modestobacter roseus TaxID=1181884 RepID=A0A562IPS7_9ACTN|nr:FAD-binding oxidoreductase [Modestobacter roseus]TWH72723.1 4-cresol dehydrogenase (hydroxylating) [Modestobacter roseus]